MTNHAVDYLICSVVRQHGPVAIRDLKRRLPDVDASQIDERTRALYKGGQLRAIGENSQRRYAVADR